jgi:hypothetical protein
MDKREIFLFLLLSCMVGAVNKSFAQSASASQRVELQIKTRIEFAAMGVTSSTGQEFKVRSNGNVVINTTEEATAKTSVGERNLFLPRGEQVFALNNTGRKQKMPTHASGMVYTATAP